jgi:leucyl aminopeptidase (aminopeptidase T)
MIGTKDLQIEGITIDEKKVTIFKDGNFAFWFIKKLFF